MRLLLIRTSAMGDIVHCLPALRVLREELPQARIAWVVEDLFAPLLWNDPDIDELFPVRLQKWRQTPASPATWRDARQAQAAIDDYNADVVLDMMGNHKAGVLAALSGSDRRIGLRRHDRREPSSAMWLSDSVPAQGGHAVERALSLLAGIGLPTDFRGFGAEQLALAGEGGGFESGDRIVIHPGAAWPNKCYPADRWGQVAATLAEHGEVVLSVGPGEEALGAEIEAASGGRAHTAEARGLASLVDLMRGARLVLGGDTGPTHLAHALDAPTLFLHGPTDPATHGPYAAMERALWVQLPCSFCHRRFGTKQLCLIDLKPSRVVAKALEIMEIR
ncbi:MAG: glycosyltransferase family 9 protein [Acidobacteriota bacterium]|nr:glycosyltransferase family 9 protein [Acidobacteriota bacterium]